MPITFPSNPTTNQTYTAGGKTWTYNGKGWSASSNVSVSGGGATVTVANTAPTSPTEGALWVDSDYGDLNAYFSNAWVIVGGGAGIITTPPTIEGITGSITTLTSGNLTLSGNNFGTIQGTVRFTFNNNVSDTYAVPVTQTSIVTGIPAAVYNSNVGVTGSIRFIKPDGSESNSFATTIVAPALSVQYLVVAGGGSGGGSTGGGGGAGGFRTNVPGSVSGGGAAAESEFIASTGVGYTVTVGAGAAQASQQSAGITGSNSRFATVTSLGGGGGAYSSPGGGGGGGQTGGSGGGASGYGGTFPAAPGTSGQGYGGGGPGNGNSLGGGGGAGGPGTASTPSRSGDGGPGANTSITGTSVTYGGGGGGGQNGLGGLGGGGNGNNANGGAATVNTGGGGAGGWDYSGGSGGAGGSGIVILKFPNYYSLTVGVGLTFSNTTNSGFKIFTFTAGTGTITFS